MYQMDEMMSLHGIYHNEKSQMIVFMCSNGPIYDVYIANEMCDIETVELLNNRVVRMNGAMGLYNGVNCITWEGGTKWKRVVMTKAQYYMIARRSHTPLTLTAMLVLNNVMRRMVIAFLAMFVWKTSLLATK